MQTTKETADECRIELKNVGGVDEETYDLSDGINVLTGPNASNKTSLLEGIAGALGSDNISLKTGKDEGYAKLTFRGEEYVCKLSRTEDGEVVRVGDRYIEDTTKADLFAFLLKDNEAKETIIRGDDIYDIIMAPIDTEEIKEKVRKISRQIDIEEEKLDRFKNAERKIPDVKTDIKDKKDYIGDLEKELKELHKKEEKLSKGSVDEEYEGLKKRMNEVVSDIRIKENRVGRIDDNIDKLKKKIESDKDSLESKRDEFEDTEEPSWSDVEKLKVRVRGINDDISGLEEEIDLLNNVVEANKKIVNKDNIILDQKEDTHSSEDLLEETFLRDNGAEGEDMGKERICWGCGTKTTVGDLRSTISTLNQVIIGKEEKIDELEKEKRDITEEIEDIESDIEKYEGLEKSIDDLVSKIESNEGNLEEKKKEKQNLNKDISELKEKEKELEEELKEKKEMENDGDDSDEGIKLGKKITRKETELEDAKDALSRLKEKKKGFEKDAAKIEEIKQKVKSLKREKEDAKRKKEDLEEMVIEEFNNHVSNLIDLLDFDNLDMVQMVTVEKSQSVKNRGIVEKTFELNITRTDDRGVGYSETISNLSESEQEVVALVFALSGYLTYNVGDEMPVILMDSVEDVDAEKSNKLLDYFGSRVEMLVCTLLPGKVDKMDCDEYNMVTLGSSL